MASEPQGLAEEAKRMSGNTAARYLLHRFEANTYHVTLFIPVPQRESVVTCRKDFSRIPSCVAETIFRQFYFACAWEPRFTDRNSRAARMARRLVTNGTRQDR